MSQLRRIMQKLAQTQPAQNPSQESAAETRQELVRLHVASYEQQLADCSEPMLQYEWAWLENHIAELELCLHQPQMLQAVGGHAHVEQLLQESQQCQAILEETMRLRHVEPSRHGHAVSVGEHAWEVCQDGIKRLWGLEL